MSVDELSIDEMSVDEMSVEENADYSPGFVSLFCKYLSIVKLRCLHDSGNLCMINFKEYYKKLGLTT
jgi:hypothetical protein